MNRYDWLIVAATAAFVVALFVLGSGPSGGVVEVLKHPASAAWVQAVGSVAAILAAIWIAGSARSEQRRERRVDAYNAAMVALQAGKVLIENADTATREQTWQTPNVEMCRRQCSDIRGMIERISISDMPGEVAAAHLWNCFRVLHTAEAALTLIQSAVDAEQEYPLNGLDGISLEFNRQVMALDRGARDWFRRKGW